MTPLVSPQAGAIILAVWLVVEGGAFYFYYRIKDPVLKRKWHPWVVAAMGVLFAAMVMFLDLTLKTRLVVAAFTAGLVFMGIRNIFFCDSCGTTLYRYFAMGKMNYCPICGIKLP